VKRAVNYLRERAPDSHTTTRVLKALVWTTAISPLLVSVHPALAYVGYMQEGIGRQSSGMNVVLPATAIGILYKVSRQPAKRKKEIKRIKKAYEKVQEEVAEFMAVEGEAESDADIMASLRKKKEELADDDDDDDEDAAPPADDDAPPPPPPAPKKRMTMAEKIKAKEEEMKKKNSGSGS
jgi:hypothetical protein